MTAKPSGSSWTSPDASRTRAHAARQVRAYVPLPRQAPLRAATAAHAPAWDRFGETAVALAVGMRPLGPLPVGLVVTENAAARDSCGLGSVVDAEFRVQAPKLGLDGVLADVKLLGEFRIGHSGGQ